MDKSIQRRDGGVNCWRIPGNLRHLLPSRRRMSIQVVADSQMPKDKLL